jgi:predicted ATPase with chaperone activity
MPKHSKNASRRDVKMVFEGPTGSGKSLLLHRIRDLLSELGLEVRQTDEHELIVHNVARTLVRGVLAEQPPLRKAA